MAKWRVLIFLSTLIVVGVVGTFVTFYARGYRLNLKTLRFQPNGILVVKSEPDGASLYINGELKTATNATISLPPGTYDVEVKKDGFFSWYKRLTIEKEVVTSVNLSLFRTVPSLSPVTFAGAANPIISDDESKIAYIITPSKENGTDKTGLWVMDIYNLPLGFNREARRITDGDLTGATYSFSPDAKQILLTTSNGIFVLESGSFTAQAQRVNISSQKATILAQWEKDKKSKRDSLLRYLPPQISDVLERKTSNLVFSPDENMILYQASTSGDLPEGLVKPLPGSSTQKQARSIEKDNVYVYDIKEDRNFLIDSGGIMPYWLPTGRHLLLPLEAQVSIIDYDGTNKQVVYSGAYIAPFAYPFSNTSKLLILTSLGSGSTTPNLYSLTIK